jgi:hypothetical protein
MSQLSDPIKTCPDCSQPFKAYTILDGAFQVEPVCCKWCRYLLKIEIDAQLMTFRPWETHESAKEWIERMGIQRKRSYWT